jgi:Zn-dependent protease/CBS domain-containing protein
LRLSFKIGALWGIPIEVHATFLLLIAIVFVFSYPALYGFLLTLLLFGFVVAHELSHSLVARHYRIRVLRIVLYPIGGVSEIDEIRESPRVEWRVAIAGPLASFLLGLALLAIGVSLPGPRPSLYLLLSLAPTGNPAYDLAFLNIILGAFNLIPAFPMDGGRVLRALLAERWNTADATKSAAIIGRALGILIAFFGIVFNFWLVLVGIFIYTGATEETRAAAAQRALEGVLARDVMYPDAASVGPDTKLSEALDLMFRARYQNILVERDGLLCGVITWDEIRRFRPEERSLIRVGDLPMKKLAAFIDEPVAEAYRLLARENMALVPVVERDSPTKVAGVLTLESIAYAQEKARYLRR